MRQLVGSLILGALLLAPVAALAQNDQLKPPQAGTPALQGVVSGTVDSVNLSTGIVRVRGSNRTWTLNALPPQISDLNPGDLVSLRYENFRGFLWVSFEQSGRGIGGSGETKFDAQEFGQYGVVTGPISGLDKNAGLIAIRGLTFRTHPTLLEGVLPNQFVSAQYVVVGGTPWVQQIEPTESGQQPQPTQQQPQPQQESQEEQQ